MFRTQYSEKKSFYSKTGSYLKPEYQLSFNEEGIAYLKQVGVTDTYKFIQSHRDSTDLAMILSRLDAASVNNMLNSYDYEDLLNTDVIDVFSLPKNPGDLLNLVKQGEEIFKGLPVDVREAFNFSPQKFISTFGNQEFMNRLNAVANARGQTTDPVVKSGKSGIKPNPEYQISKKGSVDHEE